MANNIYTSALMKQLVAQQEENNRLLRELVSLLKFNTNEISNIEVQEPAKPLSGKG